MVVISDVSEIDEVIDGVEARRVILEMLLNGPKSGVELRHGLAVRFNKTVTEISDAVLYTNLQVLESVGLIRRCRSLDNWKTKLAEIVPEKIQIVRKYFEVSVPVVCVGGLEDPEHLIDVRTVLERELKPSKYIYLVREDLKNRFSGVSEKITFEVFKQDVWEEGFEELYSRVKRIVEQEIADFEVVFDMTNGSRVCILALSKLSWEYNLRCFYIQKKGGSGRFIWIKK